jgi:hypothetical protein
LDEKIKYWGHKMSGVSACYGNLKYHKILQENYKYLGHSLGGVFAMPSKIFSINLAQKNRLLTIQ